MNWLLNLSATTPAPEREAGCGPVVARSCSAIARSLCRTAGRATLSRISSDRERYRLAKGASVAETRPRLTWLPEQAVAQVAAVQQSAKASEEIQNAYNNDNKKTLGDRQVPKMSF